MPISQTDHSLNRAIIKENIKDFITAIKSGASLESASGEPKMSSNEQIQAMINFVNAHKETPKNIIVTLLEWNLSAECYTLLAGYEPENLKEIIQEGNDICRKPKGYKHPPV